MKQGTCYLLSYPSWHLCLDGTEEPCKQAIRIVCMNSYKPCYMILGSKYSQPEMKIMVYNKVKTVFTSLAAEDVSPTSL